MPIFSYRFVWGTLSHLSVLGKQLFTIFVNQLPRVIITIKKRTVLKTHNRKGHKKQKTAFSNHKKRYTGKSLILTFYRGLMESSGLILYGYLLWRLWHGKEEWKRLGERLGQPSQPRPYGPLVWVHAASVGESITILPLVRMILVEYSSLSIIMTTCSVSAAHLLVKNLSTNRVLHQYMPIDRPIFLRKFLDHWLPILVLWTESEFWPNTLLEIQQRAIPLVLTNGRISERSFQRWQKWPQSIRPVLAAFNLCLGQTEHDCKRLSDLGARWTECVGNLKFASPPLPADAQNLAQIRADLVGRPVWLAASTHIGEEALIGRVHKNLVISYPKLLTLIIPRHPFRGAAIAAELTATGLQVTRRSIKEGMPLVSGIYIADTIGELGLFFRIAPIVFMGKSFFNGGGHNPLEPARLGCAVLFGPHMGNFTDIAARMVTIGAARIVNDETQLYAEVAFLLKEINFRSSMGRAGQIFATKEEKVLPLILNYISFYLNKSVVSDRSAGS